MGSNDPPPFIPHSPFPNGVDPMGLWQPFSGGSEQYDSSFQFDYAPPFKRPKSSDDDLQTSVAYPPMNDRVPRTNPPVNPPGKIFFKTRLCAKFRMGQCRNGENCNFAHGEEDRRKPPPNWQELVAGRADDRGSGGNWEDDDKIIHRMKLCKKFYNGEECPYGERCNFLHKEPPKHRDAPGAGRFRESPRETSVISIGTNAGPPVMQQASGFDQFSGNRAVVEAGFEASRGNVRPVYWKTKICTKWEITGHCPFGEKCHFAHGHSELQMSGGRPGEPELVDLSSNAPKPLIPAPVNEPVAARTETFTAASDQEGHQGKKCLLKWKVTKKLNRIYADWIDDMPLNLPNEVEG